jgi:hypothetical protein
MATPTPKNVRPEGAEDRADELQVSIATSNTKLNSNPYCRVSLLHCEDACPGITDPIADDARASTVRFIDTPVEVPPAMYFDCSKIRKLDKVFSRKVEDPQNDDCQAALETSDPSETSNDGDCAAPSPKHEESPRRKYPKRNPCPTCPTARMAKHVVIQTVVS